ncbi:glycosyltransferase [Candidatus Microgenomates bacterium]|nr:MAG: glycosyltransferase [Candidatus Microgenomates bacterium]
MNKIFLSVVIPCFEEMANLQKGVLDKVKHFLDKKKYKYEVVIVDDGSKDGSIEFIEEFTKENSNFRLIKNSHLGKAGTVTTGVLKAKGEFVLFTDMDQATPIEEAENLLPFFSQGYDVVIGSRKSQRKGAPWTRILMARGMMLLRSFLIGIKDISDTQCGFKMFKNSVAQNLFSKVNDLHHGFQKVSGSSVSAGFDVELLYLSEKMGYKIKEVPVKWLYVETRRVSPIKDSIDGLVDLMKIKINDLKGEYK